MIFNSNDPEVAPPHNTGVSPVGDNELYSILISRVRYKKEAVLDSDKPSSIQKRSVLNPSQTANKELYSILISRVRYKKEIVLETSQTAKRVVLDFDKPCSIQKLTGGGRGKRKVKVYNQNKSVVGTVFRAKWR
jgi:hypothetical protein